MKSSAFEQVYKLVIQIPKGKVLTYGEISKRINRRLSAAAVGWAMNALGNKGSETKYTLENVPWHRVINSKGKLSTHHESADLDKNGRPINLQRRMLEKEGIKFGPDETIDLGVYLWQE